MIDYLSTSKSQRNYHRVAERLSQAVWNTRILPKYLLFERSHFLIIEHMWGVDGTSMYHSRIADAKA